MANSARQIRHSGLYTTGDKVKLRHPLDHAGSFDDPHAVLEVMAVHFFSPNARPTYVLSEEGGPGVVPFHDNDLVPAPPESGAE